MQAENTAREAATRIDVTLADEDRTPCEVWTRVMGYHRPVASFNHGKRSEYEERVCFIEPDAAGL